MRACSGSVIDSSGGARQDEDRVRSALHQRLGDAAHQRALHRAVARASR